MHSDSCLPNLGGYNCLMPQNAAFTYGSERFSSTTLRRELPLLFVMARRPHSLSMHASCIVALYRGQDRTSESNNEN